MLARPRQQSLTYTGLLPYPLVKTGGTPGLMQVTARARAQKKGQGMIGHSTSFRGYTFKQLLLAVIALALVVRVVFSAVPAPEEDTVTVHPAQKNPLVLAEQPSMPKEAPIAPQTDASIIEVMPFNPKGSVPAPLIASILRQHRPELTDRQADELMDTLPPGAESRMIVILPQGAEVAGDETF